MKKYLQNSEMISSAMEHIRKVYPWTKNLKINLEKTAKGEYKGRVQLKFQNIFLQVQKIGPTAHDALDKSVQAIYHRLQKVKETRRRWVLKTEH